MKLYTTQKTFEESGVKIRQDNGFNRLVLLVENEEFIIPIDEKVILTPSENNQFNINCFSLEQYRASKILRIVQSQKCGDNSILLIGKIQAERGYTLKVDNPYGFEGELIYQMEKTTTHSGWTLYIVAVIKPQNNLVLEEHLAINNKDPDYIIYTNEEGELRKYKLTQPEYESLLREQDKNWGTRIL
jgi:hypothetical protein